MLKTKSQIATAIAIFFHAIGLIGMFINKEFFVGLTAINLLLMLGLLIYTQKKISIGFVLFFVFCFVTGVAVEIIGVNTGNLFGDYTYSKMLGVAIKNVPLIIGVNWFIIMYCCGILVHTILGEASLKLQQMTKMPVPALKVISIISDGAMVAVLFDWIMEPAAVKLGYWKWLGDGDIPSYNYLSWLGVSTILMAAFGLLKFDKQNIFAINLLLTMAMFFMLIRTFL
jgi:bisanhydrobacterioruberin hydratase